MTLLITRPLSDSGDLIAALSARGHAVIAAPLFDIAYTDGPEIAVSNYQGVLATSANGVRALARRTKERTTPIFAVGDATAREAQSLGFEAVRSADGDVSSLANLIMMANLPVDRPLLHVAGTVVAGDLAGTLTKTGYTVERIVLYEACPRQRLSDAAEHALRLHEISGILVYSPRTGRLLVDAVKRAALEGNLTTVTLFALSNAVAAACNDLAWRDIRVARHPTSEELLATLDGGV